jgi:hypothetical protein
MLTIHAPIDGARPQLAPEQLAAMHEASARLARSAPPIFPSGITAAVIVARETEEGYIRRVAAAVEGALRQLPPSDECWVGLYWTNGAPVQAIVAALDWDQVPDHVLGLLFLGCALAFPHRNIDCYTVVASRGADQADMEVDSAYDKEIARPGV